MSAPNKNSNPLSKGRYALLLGVILLHGIVFWILSGYIIFPAPPAPVADDAPMQRIALPAKPIQPPPPAPSGGGSITTMPLPTVATPTAVITLTANMTFTVPKVTMPTDAALLAKIGPSGGTSTGDGTGDGSGHVNTGVGVTGKDGRFILGGAFGLKSLNVHAKDIDALRNDPALASIRWENYHPHWMLPIPSDPSNWKPANRDDPKPDELSDKIVGQITIADYYPDTSEAKIKAQNIACLVIISNFNTPWGDFPRIFDRAIQDMRERHTRLCIIAFDHEPYWPLAQYSKESGGIIVYPGTGTSNSVLAAHLAAVLPELSQ